LQVSRWNWKTSSYAKLVRHRRSKVTDSPSYADYRPKTNAVIFLDMGHTLREREGGNLKLECDWCAHCGRVNKVILNSERPLWVGE
jgi:hypothetical protein